MIAALAVGEPSPALIGAVLLTLASVGIVGGTAPGTELTALDVPTTAVEGRPFEFLVRIAVDESIGRAYVDLALVGLDLVDVVGARKVGRSAFSLMSIAALAEVTVKVEPIGWGRASVGPLDLHAESPLGMLDLRLQGSTRHDIVTVPEETTLRKLMSPIETNLHVGDLISAHRGPGSEFAELRLFRDGDDPRSVNWRVSSRHQALWVNERHPEKNGDVMLVVDTQVEPGTELQALVDRSIRLAASMVRTYSKRHNRIGVVTLDGLCRWVYPGMGEHHRQRVLEQLLSVVPGEVIWEAAERAVVRAARRPSMVLVITPLMNPSMAGLIHALKRAGVDVSVIVLDVESVLPLAAGRARLLGRRIWAMERERLCDRLSGDGIPIVTWRSMDPPEVPLVQLETWRGRWRRLG